MSNINEGWDISLVTVKKEEEAKSTMFKEECHILRELSDIINRSESWSDLAKEKVTNALKCAIDSMLYVGYLAETQEDDGK